MKKTGVIIIEGHVQGLSNTRSLGEVGIPVIVVDKANCIARYSKYCIKFFKCPYYNTDDFIYFLIDLARKENIYGWLLLPSNDHAVYNISRKKELLMEFYKALIPDISVIENIYDKSRLLKIASEIKVPIPKTQYFKSNIDLLNPDLSFPVITKGTNGLSFYKTFHVKAFIANNKNELKAQLYNICCKFPLNKTFTQDLIPYNGFNKTISFTAFCHFGTIETFWMGVKHREHPLQFGTATFAESIFCEELIEPSKKLVKELNYTGVCEIEYLLDPRDKKYKLIEINARTWLWVGLAKACGIDYAKYVYNYVNGIPNEFPVKYITGIKWINYLTDLIFSLQAIFKGKLSIIDYCKSLKGNKVKAVLCKDDLKPALMFFILSFYLLKKRT